MNEYYKLLSQHPIKFKEQAKYFQKLDYINFINDIPYIDFKGRFKTGESKNVIYPITILIYEMSKISDGVLTSPDSIIELVTEPGDRSKTIINLDFPTYSIIGPWKSGLAQGLYLSYLIRLKAYHRTSKFDDIIHSAYRHLVTIRAAEGFREDSSWWIEEYPMLNNQSLVLNGHLIAVISIIEYYYAFKSEPVKEVIIDFLSKFDKIINSYDFFGWSKYCLYKNNLTNMSYHELHLDLLYYFLKEVNLYKFKNVKLVYKKWSVSRERFNRNIIYKYLIKLTRIFIGCKNRILLR